MNTTLGEWIDTLSIYCTYNWYYSERICITNVPIFNFTVCCKFATI